MTPAVLVQRAAGRTRTDTPGVQSRHSFSFGQHFDPANVGFALLVASNEEQVAPGGGFGPHPHRGIEILTWVVAGELLHQDEAGRRSLLTAGMAQRVSAGSGLVHSERNGSARDPVHFLQMWVLPDGCAGTPGYAHSDIGPALAGGGWVPVAAGRGRHAALRLGQRDASLWVARLLPGERCTLPDAPWVHLQVIIGALDLDGAGRLVAGDTVRLTAAGGPSATAVEVTEVLLWELRRKIR